jgi:hypothetical protein
MANKWMLLAMSVCLCVREREVRMRVCAWDVVGVVGGAEDMPGVSVPLS